MSGVMLRTRSMVSERAEARLIQRHSCQSTSSASQNKPRRHRIAGHRCMSFASAPGMLLMSMKRETSGSTTPACRRMRGYTIALRASRMPLCQVVK